MFILSKCCTIHALQSRLCYCSESAHVPQSLLQPYRVLRAIVPVLPDVLEQRARPSMLLQLPCMAFEDNVDVAGSVSGLWGGGRGAAGPRWARKVALQMHVIS